MQRQFDRGTEQKYVQKHNKKANKANKFNKNTPFCENCKRNVSYFILSYYRRTQN